jgi:rhodanese-related sulfurtransferase
MKNITPDRLLSAAKATTDFQIIDVREAYEVDSGNIGGLHIPMAEVTERREEIRRDVPVAVCCRSGKRAAAVVHFLETEYHFDNLYCLEGGIEAYAKETNAEITVY